MSKDSKKALTIIYYILIMSVCAYAIKDEKIEVILQFLTMLILSAILDQLINIHYEIRDKNE